MFVEAIDLEIFGKSQLRSFEAQKSAPGVEMKLLVCHLRHYSPLFSAKFRLLFFISSEIHVNSLFAQKRFRLSGHLQLSFTTKGFYSFQLKM